MNNDSHDQRRGAADSPDTAEEYRLFETAVSHFLDRVMRRDSTNANGIEDEISVQDIDTSDMPPLEHISDANPNSSNTTSQLPQASRSSRMDVDMRETAEQVSDIRNPSGDGEDDDMPGLLDESDSDSDADDVEMMVMDASDTEHEHAPDFTDMPPLEPIATPQPQQDSNRLPPQSVASTSSPNEASEAPSSSGSHNTRRAYVEDDPEDEATQLRARASTRESDDDTVRIGSRRPRVVDEDDEDGRRSMRSTNNATPVPPTPAPPSRTATPSASNTPNTHPDRPVRPLPRNGPPPTRDSPPGEQAFDPNTLFRHMLTAIFGTNTMNAGQPGPQAPAADVNGAQADPQPILNNNPEAPANAGAVPNAEAEAGQDNEDGQDVAFDMYFHFIAPDGNITTQRAGNRAQPPNQNANQNANQPEQGPAQNPNPNPHAVPQGFGNIIEQMLRAAAQGGLEEREDPERAKKLVAGLETVPDGLVKRLERVGGAPGTHEDMPGDPGCAICWDSLLHEDEDHEKDHEKEIGDNVAKAEEVSASEPVAEAPVSAPAVQGIYYQHFLLPNGLLFALPILVLDPAAASAPSPAPETPLPGNDVTSGGASADLKANQKEEVQREDSRIVALPCAHVFHAKCLIPWFSRPNQTTCPVCRFNIDPENLTYRSRPLRANPPPPRPARQRAPAPAQNDAQQYAPSTAPVNRQEVQPPQSQTVPLPAAPQAAQPGPQPLPQVRTTYTLGMGNPLLPFSVNFDLIVDGAGGVRFVRPPNAAPQPQPNPAHQPPVGQQQDNGHVEAEHQPNRAPPAPAAPAQTNNINGQTAHEAAANNAGLPQDGARLPNLGMPFNFFTPMMPMADFGFGMGPGMAFGLGAAAHPHPHPRRERKEWTIPASPGLTLRQRVEKKEREAGLRCSDVSCGIGPTDEDPTPDALADAMKQISISRDGASGKEPVCEHLFHPACLVSAGRIAGWGQQEDSGDEVEVSCPVCRKAGHVDRSEWEEGVHESEA